MGCFSSKIQPAASRMRKRLTVLVAVHFGADTTAGRHMLCTFLKKIGLKFSFLCASSPEEVVNICKTRSIDIVIMSTVFDQPSALTGPEAAGLIRSAELSMHPNQMCTKPLNWLPTIIVLVEGVELSYLGYRSEQRQRAIQSQRAESRRNGLHDIDLCMWMLCMDNSQEAVAFQRSLCSCLGCDSCFAGSEPADLCPCQQDHRSMPLPARPLGTAAQMQS